MDAQLQAEPIVIVFTDVVGSTELTEKYGLIYIHAQDIHRKIIREELALCRGTEVRMMGDGFFLTFSNGCDAAQWAKATQTRLLTQVWPAEIPLFTRIGMHWGTPARRAQVGSEIIYDGGAINFASRIMSESSGGQIFVSQAFREQTRRELPAPFDFLAQGPRNLKGFGARPVWRLVHSDIPEPPAAEKSAAEKSASGLPPANLRYPPNAHFCGRDDALRELRACLLAPDKQAVALTGMGGLGKTQMAIEYAHAYLMEYPGGVYWLDARSDERLLEDYAAIGKRFFHLSDSLSREEAAEQTRDALDRLEKPALLIFDNVTLSTNLARLPYSGRQRLLLTTQRQTLPANIFLIETPPLTEAASLQLLQVFRKPVGKKEQEAAQSIVRALGYLPLALALTSHHVRALGCSFSEYLRRLTENPLKTLQKGRDHFITATGHEGSIYDTIQIAVQENHSDGASSGRRHDHALKILTAAACFAPNSIPTDLLFRTAGITKYEDFESALLQLWERSLVLRERDESGEGRQFIHELVREYARIELLPARRKAFLARAVRAAANRLRQANRALEWTEAREDIGHCRAVAAAVLGKTPPPALAELLLEIGIYLADHRDCKTALQYYHEGLALIQSQPEPDALPRANFLRLMAEAHEHEGADADALRCVRLALRLASKARARDAPEMVDFYNSMGYILKKRQMLKRALPFYLRALAIQQTRAEARQGDVVVLNNLGALLEAQGELAGARDYFERALASAELAASGENIHVAYCLNNAGRVLSKMDCWQDALPLHERARRIFEAEQGALHPDAATSWFYIAEAQRGLKQRETARANYGRALKIYEEKCGAAHPATKKTRERLASLEAGED